MAQPALQSGELRFFTVKAESSEGTDASPSTSVNTFDLMEGKVSTAFDKVERPRDRPFFTAESFVVTNKRAMVEGGFELIPPNTPGSASGTLGNAPCEVVLFPTGLARTKSSTNSTTTYNPISTAIPTVTAYFYQSGTYYKLIGARGDISELSMMIGERLNAKIKLEGVYSTVDEIAVPTDGDYSAFTIPTVATYANSVMRGFQGTSANALPVFFWGKSLKVNLGNELKTKQYTQKRISTIEDRAATWEAVIARPAVADFDVYALRDAGTTVRLDFTTVNDDGTRYERLKIRGQIENIEAAMVDGKDFGYKLTGPCIASDAGGDDFGLEYGLDSLRLIGDLPDAAAGAYSQQLSLQGVYGSAVTYTLLSGALPAGTSLDSATGVVSGAATAGSTSGVIRATTTDIAGNAITADSSTQAVVIT